MLDLLNGVFLAATLLTNITLYSDQDYDFAADREAVVAVSTHREWWRDESKCKYTGLMVPFVRDWEEVVKHGEIETVRPPEPDKTVGHAFIINRKVCGDTVTPVFRTAEINRTWSGFLYKHSIAAFDVTDMRPDQRPKWLEQVLRRVERVSAHDANAKAFIEFNKTASFEKMPDDLAVLLKNLGDKPDAASVSSSPEATPATTQ
ncbi:hypothetical protein WJ96_04705 [Burkholderia ubonensis]|uniref:Uncharacterized protein n=1 Tax=Burkholderia ubonensis TaxID=101571 RepID=A0AAW3MVA3_9BURK|nr:hypothetical protein [Burkholderia ubonensis]KVP65671.1 hypothetical protein WJ93_24435 [Burkholderia ubonensis]KVP97873.1 hypothetical protein WJ96_04705 [Burkholderia ubonensis]KVZ92570.1 hypothetical protein WL25_16360 [Burkholderia ubonensis]